MSVLTAWKTPDGLWRVEGYRHNGRIYVRIFHNQALVADRLETPDEIHRRLVEFGAPPLLDMIED